MSVLVKPQADKIDGILRPLDIIPQSAGWQYVAFAFYHLVRGQTLRGAAHGRETALIVLSGTGQAELNGQPVGQIGERLSVFENTAPCRNSLIHRRRDGLFTSGSYRAAKDR